MASLPRLTLVGLLAGLCGGCSIDAMTYTIDRYGGLQSTHVRLGCPVPFEVYERGSARSLLVTSHPLNETACSGTPGLTTRQRQREVALTYLHETTDRPMCRLSGETELDERHREFTYTCPADTPVPAPLLRPSAGPLFGRQIVNTKRQSQ